MNNTYTTIINGIVVAALSLLLGCGSNRPNSGTKRKDGQHQQTKSSLKDKQDQQTKTSPEEALTKAKQLADKLSQDPSEASAWQVKALMAFETYKETLLGFRKAIPDKDNKHLRGYREATTAAYNLVEASQDLSRLPDMLTQAFILLDRLRKTETGTWSYESEQSKYFLASSLADASHQYQERNSKILSQDYILESLNHHVASVVASLKQTRKDFKKTNLTPSVCAIAEEALQTWRKLVQCKSSDPNQRKVQIQFDSQAEKGQQEFMQGLACVAVLLIEAIRLEKEGLYWKLQSS